MSSAAKMTGPHIVKSLAMGPGVTVNIFRNDDVPATSLDHWYAEGVVDGTGAPLEVPLHWHNNHTERFSILEGRVEATIDGVKKVAAAGETVVIPARAVHGFKGFKGERLAIRERAEPAGGYKAAFFNDLLSEGYPAPFWHTMRTFYDGDGYPSLGLYFKFFDVAFITIMGGIAKLILPPKQKLE